MSTEKYLSEVKQAKLAGQLKTNTRIILDDFAGYDWGSKEANFHHHGPNGVPKYEWEYYHNIIISFVLAYM